MDFQHSKKEDKKRMQNIGPDKKESPYFYKVHDSTLSHILNVAPNTVTALFALP